jgi:hypothetical protein
MEKPKEPKAITRMKRDLDEFISGPKQNRIGLSFNLDQDIIEELGGISKLSNSALSMNSLLGNVVSPVSNLNNELDILVQILCSQ